MVCSGLGRDCLLYSLMEDTLESCNRSRLLLCEGVGVCRPRMMQLPVPILWLQIAAATLMMMGWREPLLTFSWTSRDPHIWCGAQCRCFGSLPVPWHAMSHKLGSRGDRPADAAADVILWRVLCAGTEMSVPVQADVGMFLIKRYGQCYPQRARHAQHIYSKTFSFPCVTFSRHALHAGLG